jgi:hypothetical protein
MKLASFVCVLIFLESPLSVFAANKKMTIEVVSVSRSITLVQGRPMDNFLAKIILPDGSHALAGCNDVSGICDLDNGYPERLKRSHESATVVVTTGYPKFEAKRNGKGLTIYMAAGKRTYFIVDSW